MTAHSCPSAGATAAGLAGAVKLVVTMFMTYNKFRAPFYTPRTHITTYTFAIASVNILIYGCIARLLSTGRRVRIESDKGPQVAPPRVAQATGLFRRATRPTERKRGEQVFEPRSVFASAMIFRSAGRRAVRASRPSHPPAAMLYRG